MKREILLALTLLLAGNAFAGVVDKKAALGGFDGFVERMGAGTRELGRGNTGTADTSAMPGAYWNPAILGFRQNFNYTLNLERRSLDRMGGSLGLETPVGNRMGIGFAMLYRGDTDFKVIDEDDQTLGTATPFFSMMYLGFSYRATRRTHSAFLFRSDTTTWTYQNTTRATNWSTVLRVRSHSTSDGCASGTKNGHRPLSSGT